MGAVFANISFLRVSAASPGRLPGIQADDELYEEKDNVKEGEHPGKTVLAFEVTRKATAPIGSSTRKDAQAFNASKKINRGCSRTD